MNLLARQAEALFWLGRYIERTAGLARILLVQTAFDRGRAEGTNWDWLLALYDESQDFHERYAEADSNSVIHYFVNDAEHPGSILRCLEAARLNVRSLRAMISTDFWMHTNRAYRRVKELPESALRESRLASTCEAIQIDCYALYGISTSTLYRDAGWRFFTLGKQLERADQMSRLLDVRFAQLQTGTAEGGAALGDFTHWSMLLRACGGHHAYRRLVSGPLQPENVARFLIFEQCFARSISHCLNETEQSVLELRTVCDVPTPTRLLKRLSALRDMIHLAQGDPGLIPHLHTFNDAIQSHLIELTNDLGDCYFEIDLDPNVLAVDSSPDLEEPEWIEPQLNEDGSKDNDKPSQGSTSQTQSQTQSTS